MNPDLLPAVTPESATAPAGLPFDEIRRELALDPADYPDERLRRVFSVAQHQRYQGLPAIWATMADIDERRDAGLLDHYVRAVERDQEHEQEMRRRDQRALTVALYWGLGIVLVVALGAIIAPLGEGEQSCPGGFAVDQARPWCDAVVVVEGVSWREGEGGEGLVGPVL